MNGQEWGTVQRMARPQLRSKPDWNVPDAKDLKSVDPGNMARQFESYHCGLSEVQIEPVMRDPEEKRPVGVVQRFFPDAPAGEKPAWSARYLAKIARAWAEEYVADRKIKITFRVWLVGHDAQDMAFRKPTQMTVHPPIEDEEDDEEDEDEDDEEEEEDEEDEDEDEDEDDEEDEDETVDSKQDSNPPRTPRSDEHQDFDMDPVDAINNPMIPRERPQTTLMPKPSSGVATLHEAPQPAPASVMMINPATLVSMQKIGLDFAKGVYTEVREDDRKMMAETRATLTTMQTVMTGIVESVKNTMSDMMEKVLSGQKAQQDFFIAERQKQNERIEKLESQLIKSVELSGKTYSNLQEIAKQGWTAFVEGMEMQKASFRNDQAWQQAFFGQEISFARSEQRTEKTSSWLAQAVPIGLVFGASMMRKRGDTQTASMLDILARKFATQAADEDDEEDDEDIVDAEAHETTPPPRPGPRPGNGHAGPFASGPSAGSIPPDSMCGRCHAFRASLSAEQLKNLKAAVPSRAWAAFNDATTATSDHAAVASMTILARFFDGDPTLAFKVAQLLEEEQVEALDKLQEQLKRYRGPQRPRPSQ